MLSVAVNEQLLDKMIPATVNAKVDALTDRKLQTHLELVRLLSLITVGRSSLEQNEVHNWLELTDLVRLMSHPSLQLPLVNGMIYERAIVCCHLRSAYVAYLEINFINTKTHHNQIYVSGSAVWKFWNQIARELDEVNEHKTVD
ncbi:hypothetical protein FBUS_00870 [Fasciolopsis buskii]|uniref:Uncharacterized protein n=1 Tax=Fasciolopsis buskii TaxID=27845 RepID=A0A8E0RU89_9TREM|nr:hypothetical protein FBUS_00870 [Fasciolopsis buski]